MPPSKLDAKVFSLAPLSEGVIEHEKGILGVADKLQLFDDAISGSLLLHLFLDEPLQEFLSGIIFHLNCKR